jgi:hypothetical protein
MPTHPRKLRRGAALPPLLVASLTLLAGCGGSGSSPGNGLESKSPEAVVAAAKQAADSAATVHISGSIIAEGKPISLNMELVSGKGAKGHIALGGLGIDVVEVENAFYLNGSAGFYKHIAGSAAAQLLQGKWLKAPTTSGEFAQLAQLTNLSKLIDTTLSSHGALKRSGTTTLAGEKVVAVTDSTKGGTLYVAATGTPYPLEIAKTGTGAGQIRFSNWNKPVSLQAPPNPININQLQNGH